MNKEPISHGTELPPQSTKDLLKDIKRTITPKELLADRQKLLALKNALTAAHQADVDTNSYKDENQSLVVERPAISLTVHSGEANDNVSIYEDTSYLYQGDYFKLKEEGSDKHLYMLGQAPAESLRTEDEITETTGYVPRQLSADAKERMAEALQLNPEEVDERLADREFDNDHDWPGYEDDFSKYNNPTEVKFTDTLFRFASRGGKVEYFNNVTQTWETHESPTGSTKEYIPRSKKVGNRIVSMLFQK